MNGKSLTPDTVLRERLKELMPQVFNEGKIDREKLLASLGEDIDFSNERYVLNWAGKSDCFRVLQTPATETLVPVKDDSVNFDETGNIFIEGENLEVLKVLQKTYFGKVKMIYIDPPYNTGNDSFIYPDRFSESKEEYQKRIGDKDEEGYMTREGMFRKNSKENGQYHSNWLSMIYPRLFLARNLLRDDGVIFVSIDDNEVHNLRMVMNEIFGEENFVDCIIWKKRYGGGSKEKHLVSLHEYVLFYCKNINTLQEIFVPLDNESIDKYYKLKDEKFETRGPYRTHPLEAGKAMDERPNLVFPITAPNGDIIYPKKQWLWSKERVNKAVSNNELEFNKGKDGWVVCSKQYLKDEDGNIRDAKVFSIIDDIYTQHGTNEMIKILSDAKIFSYPKPSTFIKKFIEIGTGLDSDIILDFFAGSGTTAHAVLDLNREDSGNRRFICVQLPEPCDEKSEAFKAGYKTIAEIGKERIRRVINKINEEESGKLGFDDKKQDLGFKVFRLTESNFRQWRSDIKTGEELIRQMDIFKDPVREGSADLDVVYELILKSGKDLNSSIEHKNGAYIINAGEMAVLTEKCDKKTIDAVIKLKPAKVIALDRIFKENDQLKTNTALQMKDAGIEFKAV